jgi:hypothetical protein
VLECGDTRVCVVEMLFVRKVLSEEFKSLFLDASEDRYIARFTRVVYIL